MGWTVTFMSLCCSVEDTALYCPYVCSTSDTYYINSVYFVKLQLEEEQCLDLFPAPSWSGNLAAMGTWESRLWFQITTLLYNTFNISPNPTSFSLAFRYCHHPFHSTSPPCLFQVLQQRWPSMGKKAGISQPEFLRRRHHWGSAFKIPKQVDSRSPCARDCEEEGMLKQSAAECDAVTKWEWARDRDQEGSVVKRWNAGTGLGINIWFNRYITAQRSSSQTIRLAIPHTLKNFVSNWPSHRNDKWICVLENIQYPQELGVKL